MVCHGFCLADAYVSLKRSRAFGKLRITHDNIGHLLALEGELLGCFSLGHVEETLVLDEFVLATSRSDVEYKPITKVDEEGLGSNERLAALHAMKYNQVTKATIIAVQFDTGEEIAAALGLIHRLELRPAGIRFFCRLW